MRPSPRIALVSLIYLAVAASLYSIAALAPGARVVPYLAAHVALSACMFDAWRRGRSDADAWVVVATGVAARALIVGVPTFTTTDVQRYLWDGAVALAGADPYALPPLSTELAGLRGSFPFPSDHLDVATCYPPLALALFALAARAGAGSAWWVWKVLVTACSTLTLAVVATELRARGRMRHVALVAWSPLLLLEAGVGAHLDALVACAMACAVVSSARRKDHLAAIFVGVVAALKIVPGVVALGLASGARRPYRFLLVAALPLGVSLLGSEVLGLTPPGSLPTVAENWSFAAPLWSLLYALFPFEDAVIRPALALAALAALLGLSLRTGVLRGARDALGVQLLASPVLYPWYGSSLAVASALAPARWALYLLAVMPFSYEVLDAYQRDGTWSPAWWPVLLNGAALAYGASVDARREDED